MNEPPPPPVYPPGNAPPPPPPPPPPSAPSSVPAPTLASRFRSNPAPLGSLAVAVFALVLLALDRTSVGTSNGAFEGALIAAIAAMIAGAIGLLTAIKFGVTAALLSGAGLILGLVVLIVELSSSPA
jgi:hypothetical protein